MKGSIIGGRAVAAGAALLPLRRRAALAVLEGETGGATGRPARGQTRAAA